MPSKGIDYYFINTSGTGLSVTAKNADDSDAMEPLNVVNSVDSISKGNCQIQTDLPFHLYGSISFTAGSQEFNESINALTGNSSGDLSNMMDTPSVLTETTNLSYGFFDSGSGTGTGLTNQNQLYAYLTSPQGNWMTDMVNQRPTLRNAPFSTFVLPGAHDSGTFDLTAVNTLLGSSAGLAALMPFLYMWFPGVIVTALSAVQISKIVVGEAVTQKDTITTMLDLGCRYFDFRPGSLPTPLNVLLPDIYHIHAVIPGYPLSSFLKDILNWLAAHPGEIVVIDLVTSGFLDSIVVPTTDALKQQLNDAQTATNTGSIAIGSAADLQTSYNDLITQNKRLFFLNAADSGFSGWNSAQRYDSYNDNYKTTNPQVIINAISDMNKAGQDGKDFTILQLQGTAQGQSIAAIVGSLLVSLSKAYEPLMSTKPNFDSNTYPWLLSNVTNNLNNNNLLVLLNDFVDNALAVVAADLTAARNP